MPSSKKQLLIFFQAEDGIRDRNVTGVQTCALPIFGLRPCALFGHQAPETRLVHGDALLGGHLEGEVDREPVRVVQLERLVRSEERRVGKEWRCRRWQ